MTARTKATIQRTRAKFLAALAETCSITRAAKAAKIHRQLAYEWRDDDPEFAAAWEVALDKGADYLEDVAVKRAADGTLKPVFQGGVKVGQVREYSDTLMCLLLKAHKPEKFRERSEVKNEGSLVVNVLTGVPEK